MHSLWKRSSEALKKRGTTSQYFSATPSQGASVTNSASNRCGQSGKKTAPEFTSGSQKTGCAKRIFSVQRPFPVCESKVRTNWVQGFSHAAAKIKVDAEHPARMPETPSSSCRCNIGKMPRKIPVKCAIPGCHRRIKMTLAEREELRRAGRENNAAAGLVCPAHVKAAFNFEFDDIDIDVPLEELLVEAFKESPRWRVMLTPLSGAVGEPDSQSTLEGGQGHLVHPHWLATPGRIQACSGEALGMARFFVPLPGLWSCFSSCRWPPLRELSVLRQEEMRTLRPARRGDAVLG